MTAGAFDRLLYTDCRAGTGRGAGGGFQVQAQSVGVDAAQSKMAVGWLLYDAPNAWIMQGRAVEDFPLGFAHACEAGYGTAQSRYVGTEATGARQGNHLADCLLTRYLDLYGPARPAQLWRSPLWRGEAWDSKECPQFVQMPPLGPLTVDAVAEWLQGRPDRAPVLARLLSVLEVPAGRRAVITAAGPDEALTWIAAATLLLPVRAALEVSFKVFCSNPQRAVQRIVAVPKELNTQVAPGRPDSAFVLDAEECVSDDAEVSMRARFWVAQFAGADDPYDVVDAVELADSLDPGTGQAGTDAMVTAWAVTVPDSPLADPQALFRWLSGAGPKVLTDHGPAVARRLLAASPPAAVLRWIDTAAGLGRIDIDRPAVRSRLLTAEIAEVRSGAAAPPGEVLAGVAADADARRDADSELSSAIVLGSAPQVDLLLRVSRRHRIEPQLPPLLDTLRAFVTGWIDNPALDYSPSDWAMREEILDIAHAELQVRLAERGVPAVLGTLKRLWPHFADRRGDPTDPLDCHLEIAALRELPSKQRPVRLSELLGQARNSVRPAATIAAIQRALIEWEALGPAEASQVLTALPDSVPVAPELLEIMMDELERSAGRPTGPMLDALGVLDRRRLAPSAHPFPSLLAADREVTRFIEATHTTQFRADVHYARYCVAELGQAEPAVTRARLGPLMQACLQFPDAALLAAVLRALHPPQPSMLIDLWGRELGGQQSTRAAVWGVYWADDPSLPDKLRSRIADTIREYGTTLSPADREKWFLEVDGYLSPEHAKTWADFVGYEITKRRGRRSRGKDAR
jgi:hypothetical protein